MAWVATLVLWLRIFYFEQIRVFQAGHLSREYISME